MRPTSLDGSGEVEWGDVRRCGGHDITSSLEPVNIDTSILEDYISKEDDSTDICFSEVHSGAPGANSYSLTQAGVSSAGSLLCGVSSPISLRQGNPHPQQTPYPPPPPLGLLRHNNYPCCLGQQHHHQNQQQQQQNHIKPEHRGNYAPGTLPESPPDSSSEPYSPQQVNDQWEDYDVSDQWDYDVSDHLEGTTMCQISGGLRCGSDQWDYDVSDQCEDYDVSANQWDYDVSDQWRTTMWSDQWTTMCQITVEDYDVSDQ
ncbi:myelin regulatory factor-like [Salvelinus sp. IW2-2015]|uniref:myelin regulatory factor-like n=1 Tax=Salvelinus sp. IW2-2015 TaxID=2691554 RepID=UPI000CEA8929|nr:myelin regulatory factor-like [Salvelinus alpinus]